MLTTTQTATVLGTTSSKVITRIATSTVEIKGVTSILLSSYFPRMYAVPNSINYCMSTWKEESGFNCHHSQGNSRHTLVTGTKSDIGIPVSKQWLAGRSFGPDYWEDSITLAYRKKYGDTPEVVDGLYAHGLSASMGAYNIIGCKAWKYTLGSNEYVDMATAEGLMVDLYTSGQRVIDIFPDTFNGRRRSILTGLILLNWKFEAILPNRMSAKSASLVGGIAGKLPTDDQALLLATGAYLGWASDSNGTTGASRLAKIKSTTSWDRDVAANSIAIPTTGGVTNSGTPQKGPGCA